MHARQREADVLGKFHDDLVADVPRIPYIEDAPSARATVEAMQTQGLALPKLK